MAAIESGADVAALVGALKEREAAIACLEGELVKLPTEPQEPLGEVDEAELRNLIPSVLTALVRRGADFSTAEDAPGEAFSRYGTVT